MEIIFWIVFGGLVGWIASIIMKTDSQQGIMLNIAVGIVGSVVGGWLMKSLGGSGVTGFNFYSFFVAILGSIVLISLVKLFRKV